MADDIRQWDFGSPGSGRGSGGGDTEGGDDDSRRRKREEEKSPEERAKEARDKVEDARKKAKRAKEEVQKAPKRVKQLKEAADKAAKGAKKAGEAAKKAGEAAGKAAKKGAEAVKPAAQAAGRAAAQTAAKLAEITARVAAEVGKKAAQVGAKVLQTVVKLLANPYVLAAVILIVLVVLLFQIFTGSVNEISSLAGGSNVVPANYSNAADRQIVARVLEKTQGCDPKLVVYEGGREDLNWKLDPATTTYSHALDIRVLKTLDYLTDRHRIRIDLLKSGAPDILRDSFLKKKAQYSVTGEDEVEPKETLSAFSLGQALAIVEIDRTKIPELQQADTACGAPVPAPIEVGWQRTVGEKTIRPIWEELAYSVGFLDKNVPIYEGISKRNDEAAVERVAKSYKASEPLDGAYDLFKETFRKLPRIIQLTDRALAYGEKKQNGTQALDARTIVYLEKVKENYQPLADLVKNVNPEMSDEALAEIVLQIGTPENVERFRTGTRFAYKATQVKNSVNWDKRKRNGDLTWIKADESRNKIREVIAELLTMPRDTSLAGTAKLFDADLVVKQIITFSPEDDLDNGLERLDIFPKGIAAVDTGGVAFETLGTDDETGNMVGDGQVDAMDSHFSHAPIDNGVFSKTGTNYVYKKVKPEDSGWEKAGAFIWQYLTIPGQLASANDKLHDLLVGGCVADLNESCRKVSYRDFLVVAF